MRCSNEAQFWDGRAADLKEQAKGPVQASVEMNNTPAQVEETLKSLPAYVALFQKAYPDDPDPVNFESMAHAIGGIREHPGDPPLALRPVPGRRRHPGRDRAQGPGAVHEQGLRGLPPGHQRRRPGLFPFGVVQKPGADILPPDDKGRFTVTNTASDEYVFRAGPLRNIALTAPYFHSGDVWSLEQAVAIVGSSQLGQALDEGEVKAITHFLHTLTGEQPQVIYPILPPSTSATPRPQK